MNVHCGHKYFKQNSSISSTFTEPNKTNETSNERYLNTLQKTSKTYINILKKHISTLYTQLTQEKKADPILTLMIFFNMFQTFQINKIDF